MYRAQLVCEIDFGMRLSPAQRALLARLMRRANLDSEQASAVVRRASGRRIPVVAWMSAGYLSLLQILLTPKLLEPISRPIQSWRPLLFAAGCFLAYGLISYLLLSPLLNLIADRRVLNQISGVDRRR
jgi:hypothetical protein